MVDQVSVAFTIPVAVETEVDADVNGGASWPVTTFDVRTVEGRGAVVVVVVVGAGFGLGFGTVVVVVDVEVVVGFGGDVVVVGATVVVVDVVVVVEVDVVVVDFGGEVVVVVDVVVGFGSVVVVAASASCPPRPWAPVGIRCRKTAPPASAPRINTAAPMTRGSGGRDRSFDRRAGRGALRPEAAGFGRRWAATSLIELTRPPRSEDGCGASSERRVRPIRGPSPATPSGHRRG